MAQMVKNLPAMRETQVRPLDWEDPLQKEMATDSSIQPWRTPWTKPQDWKSLLFILQSQRKAMPKNVQSIANLQSSHTLAK